MTWKPYQTEQGEFCIDWDVCCQIIRSYHRAKAQLGHSRDVVESQVSTWNPMTWKLPDLSFVEVDWAAVRKESETRVAMDGWRLGAVAMFKPRGVDGMVHELREMQAETRRLNESLRARMRMATAKSMAAMERSVDAFESSVETARHVRDLAGSTLILAGTIATGGLASGALLGTGAGTVLKTTAKYQDTGSAASAAIEAVQNIAFTVFPAARGRALAGGEKVAKVIVSVVADTGKAILEGDSLRAAMAKGIVNVPAAVVSEGVSKALKPILAKAPLPVAVQMATVAIAKKGAEDKVKGTLLKNKDGPSAHDVQRSATASTGIMRSLSFDDHMLLKLAVIDMNKGIGNSWW